MSMTHATPADSSTSRTTPILDLSQGILAASAFALLLAGTNAITPLIPIYRQALGFSPLLVSLTFGCYVATLVTVLFVMARPRWAKWSAHSLCAALLVAALAGALISTGFEHAILLGRAFAGISGGLGTGAAAALVVAVLGDRGRSVSATGNTVGAIMGTLGAQQCVSAFGVQAIHSTYLLHALLCLAVCALLVWVLYLRRHANSRAFVAVQFTSQSRARTRLARKPLLIGCLSWIIAASSIVFMPAFFHDLGMVEVQSHCALVMLVACAVAQLGSQVLSRLIPTVRGPGILCCGITMIIAGAWLRQDTLALSGFAATGLGFGMAYRLCLLASVGKAAPAEQGALSSRYAAATYLASMVAVVGTGALGNLTGLPSATLVLFISVALALLPLLQFAPKLRDFS